MSDSAAAVTAAAGVDFSNTVYTTRARIRSYSQSPPHVRTRKDRTKRRSPCFFTGLVRVLPTPAATAVVRRIRQQGEAAMHWSGLSSNSRNDSSADGGNLPPDPLQKASAWAEYSEPVHRPGGALALPSGRHFATAPPAAKLFDRQRRGPGKEDQRPGVRCRSRRWAARLGRRGDGGGSLPGAFTIQPATGRRALSGRTPAAAAPAAAALRCRLSCLHRLSCESNPPARPPKPIGSQGPPASCWPPATCCSIRSRLCRPFESRGDRCADATDPRPPAQTQRRQLSWGPDRCSHELPARRTSRRSDRGVQPPGAPEIGDRARTDGYTSMPLSVRGQLVAARPRQWDRRLLPQAPGVDAKTARAPAIAAAAADCFVAAPRLSLDAAADAAALDEGRGSRRWFRPGTTGKTSWALLR